MGGSGRSATGGRKVMEVATDIMTFGGVICGLGAALTAYSGGTAAEAGVPIAGAGGLVILAGAELYAMGWVIEAVYPAP